MKEPHAGHNDLCLCPLTGLLDVIAKKWALLIIAILGNEGESGFNELKRELGTISPKPLSDTLKNLEGTGLIRRTILATSPPSVRYSLTPDGWELRGYLVPMLQWVSRRDGEGQPGCPIRAGTGQSASRVIKTARLIPDQK
ncbi:helix-turn-helix domain-containing protein [uncultured Methanoregula sp.]|uniref:winged helix-turn-helix transcriptional regulator n=1 Tax=uncultured Methanoregula sp. TaxID=1005933 RepID=UPI002AAAB061|nr:helix-turn-helix domain-containing protein [uncultured Methanoregula sp.]